MAWVLDLDGVVWLGGRPIAGVAEAVARLRDAGQQVLFVTNNSSEPVANHEATLAELGIPAPGAVLTSAQAVASLIEPGSRALVCAGPGVGEALAARGVTAVREGEADAVVVGFHRDFDYERLRAAYEALAGGARFLATNDDPTYPSETGPIPGGGSIVAAVATAAGREAEVAGKPYPAMVDLVRARLEAGPWVVVGDRASTDGRLARALGARFALVLSGVTGDDDLPVEPAPDVIADDLAALVETELGEPAQ